MELEQVLQTEKPLSELIAEFDKDIEKGFQLLEDFQMRVGNAWPRISAELKRLNDGSSIVHPSQLKLLLIKSQMKELSFGITLRWIAGLKDLDKDGAFIVQEVKDLLAHAEKS